MVFNDILFKRIIVNNLKLSTFSIIYDAYSIVCVYTFIRAWDISTKYDFEIFRNLHGRYFMIYVMIQTNFHNLINFADSL